MENEKMKILKMLEEKKITAEEAARLIEAVGKPGEKPAPQKRPETFERPADRPPDRPPRVERQPRERPPQPPSPSMDDFARDIQRKFEDFARRVEPAVKRVAEVVAEKADTFSKSLQPKTGPGADHAYFRAGSIEKRFDTKVEGAANQINISGLNGDVSVRGYNGSAITGKILHRPKAAARETAREIDIIKLGNKYILNYRPEDFESVSVDLFIPEKLFDNVLIDNTNGRTTVSTVISKNVLIRGRNGNAAVSDITSDNIKIECNNSILTVSNIAAREGVIENYNGSIKFTNPEVKNFKVDAFNAAVELSMENFASYDEYLWELEAANGKIYMNLPVTRDAGYYVNARANLGRVAVSLMGLEFMTRKDNAVEARTIYYDTLPVKILLRLETSNAPITIN